MVELIRLRRDTKGSTRYVEDAVARIHAMSELHGGDAEWLSQHIWNLYAQRSPLLGLWVRVQDGEVVSHLVATVQTWDGENVAWIHQAQNDGPAMDQPWWNLCVDELKRWIAEVNTAMPQAQVRRMLFSTPHDPKFFERRAGFRVYRHLLERKA